MLRSIRNSDYRDYINLLYHLNHYMENISYNHFKNLIAEENSIIKVIEINNKVVAVSKLRIVNDIGEIAFVVVLPNYRRNGYAKSLISYLIQLSRDRNLKQVDLYSPHDMIQFYLKLGFITEKVVPLPLYIRMSFKVF